MILEEFEGENLWRKSTMSNPNGSPATMSTKNGMETSLIALASLYLIQGVLATNLSDEMPLLEASTTKNSIAVSESPK